MTTKPPSKVRLAPDGILERTAYGSVASIPTVDPHDRDRLGYAVWRWLKERRDPLETAVRSAGARFLISEQEALQRIRASLKENGVEL
jgi:hypothetical protein